jgi:hypothetical protein
MIEFITFWLAKAIASFLLFLLCGVFAILFVLFLLWWGER